MASPTHLRIPPQAVDAEKALLGAIMLKPDCMYDVSDTVSSDSFYVDKHRVIYGAIRDLFAKSEPIDVLSVSERLKANKELERIGGRTYLAELANDVPASANAHHYAQLVSKTATLRALIEGAEFIAELGFDESRDLEDVLDSAEKRIMEITQTPTLHKFVSMRDELGEAWDRFETLQKSKDEMRGIPTGFKGLDNLLAGLQKADLIILAARPSMGKTSLALDIARQTAIEHGNPVGIFSLEMSSQQLVDRLLASEARVDSWKLRTGNLSTDSEFEQVREAIDRLSTAPIFMDDKPGNNILSMRSVARRMKREHGLALIIVDYLQLMSPTGKHSADSTVQQVTEISRSLKGLARELSVPVLALSQLSRAVEQRGGKPRLSDLRDSGCLAGDTKIFDPVTGTMRTIKELAEGEGTCSVLSVNGEHRVGTHTATRVFYSGKKHVYTLTTRSGRTIRASANHPFLKLEGWRRLDTLSAGDHIAVPRTLSVEQPHTRLKQAELILLAHLLGDGCILPKQPYHYTTASPMNMRHVEQAAYELFAIKARREAQQNWTHVYLPSPHRLTHGKRHPITVWYETLGIERVRSYEKRIPDAVLESDEVSIALFLRHLWATDGNLSDKNLPGRQPGVAIYYASSSKKLAESVQHLLLRLGIQSTVRERANAKGYRTMYHVHVEGARMQLRFLTKVGIADERSMNIPRYVQALERVVPNTNIDTIPREAWRLVIAPAKEEAGISWRSFADELGIAYNGTALQKSGISRERLRTMGALLQSEHVISLATSDVLWDKIVSIEPGAIEDVYDMTVPHAHNFVANDIIVHNSIEQDADVVMFIHRDDKVNENSDRPNIAEILVEKHRNGPVGKVELFFDQKKTSFLSIDTSHAASFDGAGGTDENW